MPDYVNIFPFIQVAEYLLLGGVLHFVFYGITKYLIPIVINRESIFALYWKRLQIIAWIFFLVFFFSSLVFANIKLTLSLSLLVVAIGWSYWINLFAGVIIKFSDTPKIHDVIETDLVSGKIKSIYLTYTEILNDKGELIVVPNNQLNKLIIKHINKAQTLNPFIYKYKPKKLISFDKVRQHALDCPYFTANQTIQIERSKGKAYLIKAMLIDEALKEQAIVYFES